MKNVLVTGGLGFIGFNAVKLWKKLNPELGIVIVDNMTYAAMFKIEDKLGWLDENKVPTYKFDIASSEDIKDVEGLVDWFNVDTIVNFAAESHVDNSISGPEIFYRTNVMGTFNVLDIARRRNLRFHQIGTDEVYGETFPEDETDEYSNLNPSSPYSSSKAAADLMVLSYFRTYGTNATISRCTNNFGPYQDPVKLIPSVIQKALRNEKIPIYGDGLQKRHWIHVDRHNLAIYDILANDRTERIYNIAPPADNYISNMEIVERILCRLGRDASLIEHVTDRPGHDKSYFLTSIRGVDDVHYGSLLDETVEWYREALS